MSIKNQWIDELFNTNLMIQDSASWISKDSALKKDPLLSAYVANKPHTQENIEPIYEHASTLLVETLSKRIGRDRKQKVAMTCLYVYYQISSDKRSSAQKINALLKQHQNISPYYLKKIEELFNKTNHCTDLVVAKKVNSIADLISNEKESENKARIRLVFTADELAEKSSSELVEIYEKMNLTTRVAHEEKRLAYLNEQLSNSDTEYDRKKRIFGIHSDDDLLNGNHATTRRMLLRLFHPDSNSESPVKEMTAISQTLNSMIDNNLIEQLKFDQATLKLKRLRGDTPIESMTPASLISCFLSMQNIINKLSPDQMTTLRSGWKYSDIINDFDQLHLKAETCLSTMCNAFEAATEKFETLSIGFERNLTNDMEGFISLLKNYKNGIESLYQLAGFYNQLFKTIENSNNAPALNKFINDFFATKNMCQYLQQNWLAPMTASLDRANKSIQAFYKANLDSENNIDELKQYLLSETKIPTQPAQAACACFLELLDCATHNRPLTQLSLDHDHDITLATMLSKIVANFQNKNVDNNNLSEKLNEYRYKIRLTKITEAITSVRERYLKLKRNRSRRSDIKSFANQIIRQANSGPTGDYRSNYIKAYDAISNKATTVAQDHYKNGLRARLCRRKKVGNPDLYAPISQNTNSLFKPSGKPSRLQVMLEGVVNNFRP